MNKSSKTIQVNGTTMTFETGVLAKLATSSVLARAGDTVVLAVVTMGRRETTLDYFPLSVEYVERLYAGGKIKGSRWVKREGKPSDDAILTARLIDRSIRPLFPKELKKDIQVVVTVLSVDSKNDPDVLALNAVSAAIAISRIPWNGPVGASRIGVDHATRELVINPVMDTYPVLDLDLVLTTSNTGNTIMVEAEAKQIPEKEALEAARLAQDTNKIIVAGINEWVKEIGDKKETVVKDEKMQEVIILVEKSYKDKILGLLDGGIGENVGTEIQKIADSIMTLEPEGSIDGKKIFDAVDYVFKKVVREQIVKKGSRPDGRKVDDIRELTAQAGFLPRVHGSGLFSRGDTQVLSVVTLASTAQSQLVETLEGEETKHYMHHYSFPPYSVGETGRVGFPSRREIGHGALAERAIEAVLPSLEEFPYAIRVVSEVMASNGSTSQASVVGSTIALMDAGVPITAPVAGIAIGLMTLEDKYIILTDILGLEDFAGDMDFKVAGTKNGITAIQLDVKVDKLTIEMIGEVFEKALAARLKILDVMLAAISEHRKEVSKFAPKIQMVKIDPEKIGGLIGPGGKMIKSIIATTGAEVDVEDDGSVSISAVDEEAVAKAVKWIEGLTHEVKPGETYNGTVKRMLAFGAFVEILPGKEGLVHVSEMSTEYVKDPADVLTIGQNVKVRVKEIDDQGRVNLSMKFGEDADKPTPRPEGMRDDKRSFPADRPLRREYSSRPGEDRPRRSFSGPRPAEPRSFGARRRDDRGPAPFDNQRPRGPRR